jgi:hypothetical protein
MQETERYGFHNKDKACCLMLDEIVIFGINGWLRAAVRTQHASLRRQEMTIARVKTKGTQSR